MARKNVTIGTQSTLEQYYLTGPALPSQTRDESVSSLITTQEVQSIVTDLLGNSNVPMRVKSKFIESANYVANSTGWHIDANGDCEFGSGKFRGSITGATGVFSGTISANNVTAGTLSGSTVKATNGGTNDVWMDSSDGKLKFFYSTTQYATILVDSLGNLLYGDTSGHQFFNANFTIQYGVISSGGLSLPSGKIISFSAGTTITDAGSECQIDRQVRIDGTVYPRSDKGGNCGASGKRWDTIWAKNTQFGDMSFTDRYCPICEQEFEAGDFLVNFVYKKDLTNPDIPSIVTVPAHINCVKDYKKENITKHQDFIKAKEDEREVHHQAAEVTFDLKASKHLSADKTPDNKETQEVGDSKKGA